MKKQTTAMLMAVTMAASGLTACVPKATTETTAAAVAETTGTAGGETQGEFHMNKEGLPIVDEPITYEIAAATRKNKNFKDMEYFQKLEE